MSEADVSTSGFYSYLLASTPKPEQGASTSTRSYWCSRRSSSCCEATQSAYWHRSPVRVLMRSWRPCAAAAVFKARKRFLWMSMATRRPCSSPHLLVMRLCCSNATCHCITLALRPHTVAKLDTQLGGVCEAAHEHLTAAVPRTNTRRHYAHIHSLTAVLYSDEAATLLNMPKTATATIMPKLVFAWNSPLFDLQVWELQDFKSKRQRVLPLSSTHAFLKHCTAAHLVVHSGGSIQGLASWGCASIQNRFSWLGIQQGYH